ncbi:MAG: 5-formyltetrahydrofolate cyclo-ligase [Lentisphaeria bacterium]
MAEKQRLRSRLREQGRHWDPATTADASRRIRDRLRELPEFRAASTVAIFWAMPGEVELAELAAAALAAGRQVWLPRFEPRSGDYRMVMVADLRRDLVPGAFGIVEPRPELPAVAATAGADVLWLVPGLGFDRQGGRLGRGKGFYDRLLAGAGGCKAGVAFAWQLLPAVPVAPHDIRMDLVVTERETVRVRRPEEPEQPEQPLTEG